MTGMLEILLGILQYTDIDSLGRGELVMHVS